MDALWRRVDEFRQEVAPLHLVIPLKFAGRYFMLKPAGAHFLVTDGGHLRSLYSSRALLGRSIPAPAWLYEIKTAHLPGSTPELAFTREDGLLRVRELRNGEGPTLKASTNAYSNRSASNLILPSEHAGRLVRLNNNGAYYWIMEDGRVREINTGIYLSAYSARTAPLTFVDVETGAIIIGPTRP